jgi:hypothetical protein
LEVDMTPHTPETVFIWFDVAGTTIPPRKPHDDADDEEEDDDDDETDEDLEPAVIREPDQDE